MKIKLPTSKWIRISLPLVAVLVGVSGGLWWWMPATLEGLLTSKKEAHAERLPIESHEVATEHDKEATAHSDSDTGKDENQDHKEPNAEAHEAAVVGASNHFAKATPSQLILSVVALQLVQTSAAHGNRKPENSQRKILGEISNLISNSNAPSITKKDLEALIIYVLSGGDPDSVEQLLKKITQKSKTRLVLEGAIDFVRSKHSDAKLHLTALTLEELPNNVAARVALALAQISVDNSDAERDRYLQFAIAIAPGTLVEEAAIRRIIPLKVKAAHRNFFIKWSLRYARRFANSEYSADFLELFSSGVVELAKAGSSPRIGDLKSVVDLFEFKSKLMLLQQLSRKSAKNGLLKVCEFASSEGGQLPAIERKDQQFFEVYKIACSVPSGKLTSLTELSKIDVAELQIDEKELLADATKLANSILLQDVKSEMSTDLEGELDPETVSMKASVAQQMAITSKTLEDAKR